MENYLFLAIDKLEKEQKNKKCKGAKANAVFQFVHDALLDFCKQNDEFAQAVVQNKKTLSDCCDAVTGKVGNAISDIELYKRAVGFYFPGAGVDVKLTLNLCASVQANEAAQKKPAGKVIDLSLTDLFD